MHPLERDPVELDPATVHVVAHELADARVLEVGCGTGVLTRALARVANAGSVVGVDLAPALIERARELSPDIRFDVADARSLPFADGSFDLAVFDSTLSHVPGPERALAEAFRVLRADGRHAAFDGDYATTTVALGPDDPRQACMLSIVDRGADMLQAA